MGYYLGIDLGGTNIKAGVVDDEFRIVGRAKAKTGMPRPAEEVMDAMAECAGKAAEDAGVFWEQIERIGVGVPGTANEDTGVVEYANNLMIENEVDKLDGIININKPSGITSFDVIRKLRKILKIKKIGHTGTLDPLASGVLVVCTGKATRLVQDIEKLEKEYVATFKLGVATDTYDIEGKVIDSCENFSITTDMLKETLEKFKGDIKQVPPMYSAIKINGQKLYDLARRGEVIEREARDVSIYSLDLLEFDGVNAKISCKVSKGTYIRSLIFDIGI